MYLKKYVFMAFLLAITTLGTTVQASYSVNLVDITYIRTYNDYAILTINPNGSNEDNCTHSASYKFAYIKMDNGTGKNLYNAALAAFLSERKIRLGLSGCKTWVNGTVPIAYRIDMYSAADSL